MSARIIPFPASRAKQHSLDMALPPEDDDCRTEVCPCGRLADVVYEGLYRCGACALATWPYVYD